MKTRAQRTDLATRETGTAVALPAEWQTQLAASAKQASAIEQAEVQAFSTRAGVLSYAETPLPDNKVNVIIVGSAYLSSFYISKFDPTNIVPPACFAVSPDGDEMVPHENSFKPQHESCEGCPQNEWGSDENSPSGKGKACKQTRRLAVIPADSLEEGIEKAKIAIFNVPVTSTREWSNYVHTLAASAKRPPWSVITEISLKPDTKKQFTVNFQVVDAINDPDTLEKLSKVLERAQKAAEAPFSMMTQEQFDAIVEAQNKPQKKRKF